MSPKGQNDYVCVGQFAGPHGLKGGIKLKSFTEEPGNIKGYKSFYLEGDFAPIAPRFSGTTKGGFVVTLEGVSNPEDTSKFKGKKIFIRLSVDKLTVDAISVREGLCAAIRHQNSTQVKIRQY